MTACCVLVAAAGLVRPLGGAEVDWQAGTVVSVGGAAADIRMPSPEAARPGAERRARAAAEAKLREALSVLPLGGGRTLDREGVERAVGRARAIPEYQSNGGVVLRLRAAFSDALDPGDGGAPETVALVLPSMPFEAQPRMVEAGEEAPVAWARYRSGPPPRGARAISARRDGEGRLVLERKLGVARPALLIYLQKPEGLR